MQVSAITTAVRAARTNTPAQAATIAARAKAVVAPFIGKRGVTARMTAALEAAGFSVSEVIGSFSRNSTVSGSASIYAGGVVSIQVGCSHSGRPAYWCPRVIVSLAD